MEDYLGVDQSMVGNSIHRIEVRRRGNPKTALIFKAIMAYIKMKKGSEIFEYYEGINEYTDRVNNSRLNELINSF